MLLIDAHVHLYDCYDLSRLLSAAKRNFKLHVPQSYTADTACILLLTMRADQDWPGFFSLESGKTSWGKEVEGWQFHGTEEPESIIAEDESGCRITLIAGRQIVSGEGLEVLSLLSMKPYEEGKPVMELLTDIGHDNGVAVLPWAFGKWLGKRGRIIQELQENRGEKKLFFGDNGGRPWCIPQSSVLKREQKQHRCVVSGSDPLPISGEELRVGSFGGSIVETVDWLQPAQQLRTLLLNPDTDLLPFGHPAAVAGFVRNQLKLRGIYS
jgi:hypothetical protein